MSLDNDIKIEYAKEIVDDWLSAIETTSDVDDYIWAVSTEGPEVSEEDQQDVVRKVDEIIEDLRIYVSKNY